MPLLPGLSLLRNGESSKWDDPSVIPGSHLGVSLVPGS